MHAIKSSNFIVSLKVLYKEHSKVNQKLRKLIQEADLMLKALIHLWTRTTVKVASD